MLEVQLPTDLMSGERPLPGSVVIWGSEQEMKRERKRVCEMGKRIRGERERKRSSFLSLFFLRTIMLIMRSPRS